MAAAGVHLAQRIFESIETQRILFIGAGEMIELCAAHFCAHKPKQVTIANRTLERGRVLADQYNGTAIRLDELGEYLAQHDIIVSCTASPLPIIGLGMVERAVKARRHRPMFMVDLAVPRDIEMEVGELDDVFLYTVDDLAQVVESGLESSRPPWSRPSRSSPIGFRIFLLGCRHAIPFRSFARCATRWSACAVTKSNTP